MSNHWLIIQGHTDKVTQCGFYKGYVFTSSYDNKMMIWKNELPTSNRSSLFVLLKYSNHKLRLE